MTNALEIEIAKPAAIIVDGVEYMLVFPLSVLAATERKTGISLKTVGDWVDIPNEHFATVIQAGLVKHHPNIEPQFAADFCDQATPEILYQLRLGLVYLNFPKVLKALEERKGKKDISPNIQSGDAL